MELSLRIYTLHPGTLEAFVEEWRQQILPLRRAQGWQLLGAWESAEESTFTWLLGWGGPGSIEEANERYSSSPERAAMAPDPARHIADARQLPVRAVEA
jgi:hypothetical protein